MKSCIYPPTVRERAIRVQESQTVQFHGIRYIYYLQAMHVNVQAHIKENLRKAFTAREIQIFMQPQVCLKDGAICAAQAFPYWLQPDGSWNLPEQFLPALEEAGLIEEMDFYVLEEVARLQQHYTKREMTFFPVMVTFSAATLSLPNTVEHIQKILSDYGLEGKDIQIAVQERCFFEKIEQLVLNLKELQQLGCTLCLDNFGRSSRSFSVLLQLPVHQVKLNHLQEWNGKGEQSDKEKLHDLVQLLRVVGVEIILNGVSTAEDLQLLHRLSVEKAQGSYWGASLHWRDFLHQDMLDKQQESCYYIE